jgi:hypothetical protein
VRSEWKKEEGWREEEKNKLMEEAEWEKVWSRGGGM